MNPVARDRLERDDDTVAMNTGYHNWLSAVSSWLSALGSRSVNEGKPE